MSKKWHGSKRSEEPSSSRCDAGSVLKCRVCARQFARVNGFRTDSNKHARACTCTRPQCRSDAERPWRWNQSNGAAWGPI
eukprot:3883616-Alexandrium_andersonii.AAC.1